MTVRDVRRRWRQALAAHDWFEGMSIVLGVLFLAGALACVWVLVLLIASLGDLDQGFKVSLGSLQAIRGLGIALFALLTVALSGVGWFLAGDAIRRVFRRRSV